MQRIDEGFSTKIKGDGVNGKISPREIRCNIMSGGMPGATAGYAEGRYLNMNLIDHKQDRSMLNSRINGANVVLYATCFDLSRSKVRSKVEVRPRFPVEGIAHGSANQVKLGR